MSVFSPLSAIKYWGERAVKSGPRGSRRLSVIYGFRAAAPIADFHPLILVDR